MVPAHLNQTGSVNLPSAGLRRLKVGFSSSSPGSLRGEPQILLGVVPAAFWAWIGPWCAMSVVCPMLRRRAGVAGSWPAQDDGWARRSANRSINQLLGQNAEPNHPQINDSVGEGLQLLQEQGCYQRAVFPVRFNPCLYQHIPEIVAPVCRGEVLCRWRTRMKNGRRRFRHDDRSPLSRLFSR